MNLPNLITLGRIVLSVVFVVTMSFDWPYACGTGFVLFLAASLTDFLDGWLARKHNLVTDFGKLIDPLADKILVTSAMVLLAVDRLLPAWFVIFVLFREFLVTGIRMLALSKQTVIAADFWGKFKTVVQIVLVCMILGPIGFREMGWDLLADGRICGWPLWNNVMVWKPWIEISLTHVAFLLTLVSTALSGALYLRAFARSGATLA